MDNVFFAFMLTLFAGLATGIGSLISLFAKEKDKSFLGVCLGFSAGVMIYVSFVEIFVKANESLCLAVGDSLAAVLTVVGFFSGMFFIGAIDKLMDNKRVSMEKTGGESRKKSLLRLGIFTALAIGIHNFPEGLATFLAALEDPSLGIAIAVAIAIHNIPEGYTQNVSQSKPLKNKEKNLNLQMKRKAFDKVFLFLNQKP